MPWRMISAKASCIYICDKVYKPLGVAERLLQHPEERLTASAVIYSRSRQEVWMVGDGGAWTEAQRPYLNHATLLVFILCLSFNKESRIPSPIQISIIASVLRPNVPNTPILSVDQPQN